MAEGNAAVVASELAPGTVVAGYVVDHKLGEGGMGVVYEATQPRIGKRVAIKVLTRTFGDPAALERFEQEAQFVNAIRHPNIVDVFQFGELPDGRAFFVMELLEGESVEARLKATGSIPVRMVAEILDEVCDALEAAHEKNVVHRDLKTDNVFLVATRKGIKIKLLDFGLAKLASRTTDESGVIHKTRSGIVVGTPAYIAPEQARGQGIDPRTDIYSLGVLAYKMLTGKLPFLADTAIDLVAMHLSAPVPDPRTLAPNTPAVLARLVMRMMAKERDDRPSIAEIREVLATLREPAASSTKMPAIRVPSEAASSSAGMLAELRELGGPNREPAKRSEPRGFPVRTVLGVILSGVIVFGVVAIVRDRLGSDAPPQDRVGSDPAPIAGSNRPAPAVTPQPSTAPATIEMEPDKTPRRHRSGSAATSDDKRPKPAPESGSDKPVDKPADKPHGLIVVELDAASEIEIDGASVATASRGGRFEVAPGTHTLRVKTAGAVAERTVNVSAGGSVLIRPGDETP